MTKAARLFLIAGCIFVVAAVILRVSNTPIAINMKQLKPSSFLILANSCFILAVFFKK